MLTEKDKNQIDTFLSMIYHDDKNSNYFIGYRENGKWKSKRTSIIEFEYDQLKDVDCYISINGFALYNRKSENCRQINGIVFDLDYHHKDAPEYLDWIKKRTLIVLREAIYENRLYEPNIITDTGRGLQLMYIFEKSIPYRLINGDLNGKCIYAYNRITDTIKSQIESVLAEEEDILELDKCTTNDLSRVIRIPGTMNSKSKTKANIIHINEDYYCFADFYKKKKTTSDVPTPKYQRRLKNKDALNLARIREMEKLQEIRKGNCEGYRNYMAFIYYNSAVQLYGQKEALERTRLFCSDFGDCNSSFTEAEIKAISRGIDKNTTKDFKGYYIITKEWILEKLNITDDERRSLGITNPINLRELRKMQTAQAKKERDNKILDLFALNMKRTDIAKEVNVSLRTVQNVLKTYGKTREYNVNVNVQKNAS